MCTYATADTCCTSALQEPWIAYLMTFHVLLLTTVVVQRRNQAVTASVFFLCGAL